MKVDGVNGQIDDAIAFEIQYKIAGFRENIGGFYACNKMASVLVDLKFMRTNYIFKRLYQLSTSKPESILLYTVLVCVVLWILMGILQGHALFNVERCYV